MTTDEPDAIESSPSCASMRRSSSRASARRGSFMSTCAANAVVVAKVVAAIRRKKFGFMATPLAVATTARSVPELFAANAGGTSIDLQDGEKGLLRDLHLAHPLHPLLAFLLL